MKRLLLTVMVLLLARGTAVADDPWQKGVTKDNQSKANTLFTEANQLFAQQAHGPALEKYQQAVALWEHPLIQFNMAVTLVRLDKILEAADVLDKALRFGQAPFPSKEQHQQAVDYQKLVAGRVGTVEASCEQGDAQVLLDGKPWFSCPGKKTLRVMAGEHAIVGEKKEHMPISKRVVVAGGATASAKLSFVPIESVVKLEYPTPRWLPWTVTGGGVAVALGGLGFWFAGRSQMDKFEADFAMMCPTGCRADLSDQTLLRDARDSAQLKGKIAVTMMVAGGAVTVGGVVWAIINRPKRIFPPALEVSPAEGGMTATVRGRF